MAETLQDLMREATDQGYDVIVRLRMRADGKPGTLDIPASWAERLGVFKTEF